ncbi:MAG: hypothetical protein ACPGVS_08425 [Primorskyibacter sp.]
MRVFATCVFCLTASASLAGPFDGTYRPAGDWAQGWDCRSVGQDGGALAVRDGVLYGIENACQLTNPVNVRDMTAVLYDGQCASEGYTYAERLMLMRLPDRGLAIVRDGAVTTLKRCR